MLYRVIDLPRDGRAIVMWANIIIEYPAKAALVHALSIPFERSWIKNPSRVITSLRLVAQALRSLLNLKELTLDGHPSTYMHPVYWWLLESCTFRLKKFHDKLFYPSTHLEFLSMQTDIRDWAQVGVLGTPNFSPDFLPYLTTLDADSTVISRFTFPRPIKHLKLTLNRIGSVQERHLIETLSFFGSTLANLNLFRKATALEYLNMLKIIQLLSDTTPHLKLLICEGVFHEPLPGEVQLHHYALATCNFLQLETLVLLPESNMDSYSALDRSSAIAKPFRWACPSLRRFAFSDGDRLFLHTKFPNSEVQEESFEGGAGPVQKLFNWRDTT